MKKVNNTKGFQGGGYGSKRTTQMIEKNQPKKENIKPDNRVLVTDSNGVSNPLSQFHFELARVMDACEERRRKRKG
jgi:hypothetical protein